MIEHASQLLGGAGVIIVVAVNVLHRLSEFARSWVAQCYATRRLNISVAMLERNPEVAAPLAEIVRAHEDAACRPTGRHRRPDA